MSRVSRVIVQFVRERRAQIEKWGNQSHPDGTGLLGDKERAEHAKATCQGLAAHGKVSWRDILFEEVAEAFAEKDVDALRIELRQVGAVAAAWIEDIEERMLELIDDKVSEWHEREDIDIPLHEYLGMSIHEYNNWVRDAVIPDNYHL